jgi:hypothetical protein
MFRNKIGTTNPHMAAPDIAKRQDYTNKIKDESTEYDFMKRDLRSPR